MYDLIILGAGPAGMTAGVYAARQKIDTFLLSKDQGGQVLGTLGIENYMGFQIIEGPELAEKFEDQLRQFPLPMKIGPGATRVRTIEGGFEVESGDGGTYQARSVIVATGKRPRMLNVPGEDRFRGRGMTYCSICDGPIFTGRRVAVVGGGNSALEAAHYLIKIAEHVDLISHGPLTGDRILIDKVKSAPNVSLFLGHTVVELEGNKFVEGIAVKDFKTSEIKKLPVAGVFVEIGLVPNSDPVKGLTRLNADGEIEVDCANRTGVPGLLAA